MAAPRNRYDQFADWYHDWVAHPDEDFVAQALFAATPDVRGQRVLDLGCGQGRIARSACGFVLEESIEPSGPPGEPPMTTPFFLVMRCRRSFVA